MSRSQGPRWAGTASAPGSWLNPANAAGAPNGVGAEGDYDAGVGDARALSLSDFGFTIPSGARVTGIEVALVRRGQITVDVSDRVVKLIVGTGARQIASEAKVRSGPWPAAFATALYGGETDDWALGRHASPSEINDSSFTVYVLPHLANAADKAFVDAVGVTVYYEFPVGDDLYEAVESLAFDDEENGFALRALANTLGEPFEKVAELVRDDGDKPGWSIALDVDRVPSEGLPWLAQFVGVRLDLSLSDDDQREQIRQHNGFQRGRPAAIVAAAQGHLTGTKAVTLIERDGGAYKLTVHTLAAETPDPAAVERAIRAQKPAGITLTYAAV